VRWGGLWRRTWRLQSFTDLCDHHWNRSTPAMLCAAMLERQCTRIARTLATGPVRGGRAFSGSPWLAEQASTERYPLHVNSRGQVVVRFRVSPADRSDTSFPLGVGECGRLGLADRLDPCVRRHNCQVCPGFDAAGARPG
jgi:hypothetical protein